MTSALLTTLLKCFREVTEIKTVYKAEAMARTLGLKKFLRLPKMSMWLIFLHEVEKQKQNVLFMQKKKNPNAVDSPLRLNNFSYFVKVGSPGY